MKNTIIRSLFLGLLLAAGASAAFAQGQIQFSTYNNLNSSKGEVFLPWYLGGGPVPGGTAWNAQLWFSDTGTDLAGFTALSPVVNFTTSLAGYINYGTVTDTADPPGATIWYDLRVWNAGAGSSWPGNGAGADFYAPGLLAFGISQTVQVNQLGGIDSSGDIYNVPIANGFPSFTLMPEPSTIALAVAGLGVVSLWIMRRRK